MTDAKPKSTGARAWKIILGLYAMLLAWLLVTSAISLQTVLSAIPVLMIGIGLDLIMGRGHPHRVRLVIGTLLGVVIVYMIVSSETHALQASDPATYMQTSPINIEYQGGDTTSLNVYPYIGSLTMSAQDAAIPELTPPNLLITGSIRYMSNSSIQESWRSDTRQQRVAIFNEFTSTQFGNDLSSFNQLRERLDPAQLSINIQIMRDVPLDLLIDGRDGEINVDLRDLTINTFSLQSRSSTTVNLSNESAPYIVNIDAFEDSEIEIVTEFGYGVELTITDRGGIVTVYYAPDQAIRITAEDNQRIFVPDSLEERRQGNGFEYESPDYLLAQSDQRIEVMIERRFVSTYGTIRFIELPSTISSDE